MDKDAFIRWIYDHWRERCWLDIDGGDLHEAMVRHGLLYERPITAEEAADERFSEWDVEAGDLGCFATDEMLAIINPEDRHG